MDNLFLDDIRIPYQVGNYINPVELRVLYRKSAWDIVRDYDEFVKFIETKGLPKLISFDHDLADEHYNSESWQDSTFGIYREKTGYDCAKWLVEYCEKNSLSLPEILVHSMNPIGSENIKNLINGYKERLQK